MVPRNIMLLNNLNMKIQKKAVHRHLETKTFFLFTFPFSHSVTYFLRRSYEIWYVIITHIPLKSMQLINYKFQERLTIKNNVEMFQVYILHYFDVICMYRIKFKLKAWLIVCENRKKKLAPAHPLSEISIL